MSPPPRTFDYTTRVGYAETDQMGFAHHSRYLVWFESARTEMLRATGDSYAAWEERGVMLPLVAAEVQWHKPALYDDVLTVAVHIASMDRLRLVFRYEVRCGARGVLIASGETRHVFMNKQGRPVRADPGVLQRLGAWSGGEESVELGAH